jgi:hypothetical protein
MLRAYEKTMKEATHSRGHPGLEHGFLHRRGVFVAREELAQADLTQNPIPGFTFRGA